MAKFVFLTRYRLTGDAAAVRRVYQEVLDYFTTWTPPEGVKMLELYGALDQRMDIAVFEAASHEDLAVVIAQFLPWADIEVIPVAGVEEMMASQAKGGLVTLPNS